ncbi:MAG: SufE family protein [Cellvibrio sp.]|uniref:SufE family protein n=1 Tax=Cellvibrio sp. TaxID=1965322 RepID=UPI0031A12697
MIPRDDLTSVAIADLMASTNWQQQYRLIIQWGKLVQRKPEIRVPANLIKGCELPVWLHHQDDTGLHYFAFDSDSSVINGLAVLLLTLVNGKSAAQLQGLDLKQQLQQLGLEKHLTPSRNNGLQAIIARIHQLLDAA